jgi:hypothetical protein
MVPRVGRHEDTIMEFAGEQRPAGRRREEGGGAESDETGEENTACGCGCSWLGYSD